MTSITFPLYFMLKNIKRSNSTGNRAKSRLSATNLICSVLQFLFLLPGFFTIGVYAPFGNKAIPDLSSP